MIGATIEVKGRAPVKTDSGGYFRILAEPSDLVRVRALGFEPIDTVMPHVDGMREFVIRLKNVQYLPGVDVRSRAGKPARYASTSRYDTFYERRAQRRGYFFTREDIESSGRTQVTDILRLVPGAKLVQPKRDMPLSLRFARCSGAALTPPSPLSPTAAHTNSGNAIVAVFIDGVELGRKDGVSALEGLPTAAVEAIEVFQGASQLPMEAMGNACAAVYIWTRFIPRAPADTTSPQPG